MGRRSHGKEESWEGGDSWEGGGVMERHWEETNHRKSHWGVGKSWREKSWEGGELWDLGVGESW